MIKRIAFVLCLLPALALCGAEQKKAKSRPAKAPQNVEIPRDAEKIEPYTYRHTDKTGKVWIYRETPFGIVKFPEDQARKPKPVENQDDWTAVEEGDNIRFERPSPFGKYRWIRKKSELSEAEKQVWERESRKKGSEPKAQE